MTGEQHAQHAAPGQWGAIQGATPPGGPTYAYRGGPGVVAPSARPSFASARSGTAALDYWEQRARPGFGLFLVTLSSVWLVLVFTVLKWSPDTTFARIHASARHHQFTGLPQVWFLWGAAVAVAVVVAGALAVTIPSYSKEGFASAGRALVAVLGAVAGVLDLVAVVLTYRDTGSGARWIALSGAPAFVLVGLGAMAGVHHFRTRPRPDRPFRATRWSVVGISLIVVAVVASGLAAAAQITDTKPFHVRPTARVGHCAALARLPRVTSRATLIKACYSGMDVNVDLSAGSSATPTIPSGWIGGLGVAPVSTSGLTSGTTSGGLHLDQAMHFQIQTPAGWDEESAADLADDQPSLMPGGAAATAQALYVSATPSGDDFLAVVRLSSAVYEGKDGTVPDARLMGSIARQVQDQLHQSGVGATVLAGTAPLDGVPGAQLVVPVQSGGEAAVMQVDAVIHGGAVWEVLAFGVNATVEQTSALIGTFHFTG